MALNTSLAGLELMIVESKVRQLFVFVCENDVKMSTVTSAIQVTHSQLSKKQFAVVIDLVSPLLFPQRSVIQGCKLVNCCQNGHGFC